MPAQQSILQEGVERFNTAVDSIDREVQRLQKRFESQRKSLEKQITSGRKNFEKRTRKQVNQLRSELRKNALVKRARNLRSDAAKQIEQGVDNLLGALQIASRNDLQRIDRKLGQLSRKLKEIERARKGNGEAASV